MPLRRAEQSGLFTTKFKEDAFFIDFGERALVFREGARTEQTHQLPYYFVEDGYHMRKRLIESLGFTGANGRLELFIQYPLLPVIDQQSMEGIKLEILEKAEATRRSLLKRNEQQALIDMLMLELCDEPIVFFEYDRPTFTLRIKARVPISAPEIGASRTKRGRTVFYREYEDLLCSKAAAYIVTSFERLPFVQVIELNLYRMEAETCKGLTVIGEFVEVKKDRSLQRLDPTTLPPEESPKDRKARQQAEKKQQEAEARRLKTLSKERQKIAVFQRDADPFDELFDGSLPYQSALLSARMPRQGFMDLQKSKTSYSARHALELFELRFAPDEENCFISEIEPYF